MNAERCNLPAAPTVGPVKWAYDGEKFLDGVFEVTCSQCERIVFSDGVRPANAHLAPDHLAKAANRLDSLLGGHDLATLEKEKETGRGR